MDPKNRLNEDPTQVHANIDRVRARAPRLTDERVTLAHGAGGKASATLIDQVFLGGYGNDLLREGGDSAVLARVDGRLAFSTDSYVVHPLTFPGGSIGDLAVNGTVNDLAVMGARPLALSAAFVIEEGLPIDQLREIVAAMRDAAHAAGCRSSPVTPRSSRGGRPIASTSPPPGSG